MSGYCSKIVLVFAALFTPFSSMADVPAENRIVVAEKGSGMATGKRQHKPVMLDTGAGTEAEGDPDRALVTGTVPNRSSKKKLSTDKPEEQKGNASKDMIMKGKKILQN